MIASARESASDEALHPMPSSKGQAVVQAGKRGTVGTHRQRELRRPCPLHRNAAPLEGADHEFQPPAIDRRHQALSLGADARAHRIGAGLRILQQHFLDDVRQCLLEPRPRERRHHDLQQVDVAGVEDERRGLEDRQRVEAHAHVAGRARATEDGDGQPARVRRAADLVGDRDRQHCQQHRFGRERALADGTRRHPDDRLPLPQYLCCHMSSTRLAPR